MAAALRPAFALNLKSGASRHLLHLKSSHTVDNEKNRSRIKSCRQIPVFGNALLVSALRYGGLIFCYDTHLGNASPFKNIFCFSVDFVFVWYFKFTCVETNAGESPIHNVRATIASLCSKCRRRIEYEIRRECLCVEKYMHQTPRSKRRDLREQKSASSLRVLDSKKNEVHCIKVERRD